MILDVETIAKILSPIITLFVGAIIKHYTEERPKVVSFLGHVSAFTLKDEKQTQVFTHSVIVRNTGRKPAHNVRLGHIVFPQDINIFPPVQYSIEKNPQGASEIVIPILVPKEQITISYLYFPPVTVDKINAYTKSDEGLAKIINVIPIPQPAKPAILLVWVLMLTGASFIVYWLLRLAGFLLS